MQAFAYLTIRLLAIFLVVDGLSGLSSVVLLWSTTGPDGSQLFDRSMFLVLLLPPIAGILIWLLASRLSRLAIPAKPAAADPTSLDTSAWTRLVVVVFGLYLVVGSLPNLAAIGVKALEVSAAFPESSVMGLMVKDSSTATQVAYHVVRLVLGLILVLGPMAVTRLVAVLSTSGARGGGS